MSHTYDVVYIFTECGSQIGYGHVTRCTSLYDECIRKGLQPRFVLSAESVGLTEILKDRNCLIDDWYREPWKAAKAMLDHNSYAIVDSYRADVGTYQTIADGVKQQNGISKAVYIDDTNRIGYPSGIIVNPSIFGKELQYNRKDNQIYLLGSEYIILRKEFYDLPESLEQHRAKKSGKVENILIMMGGADVRNLTPQIMDALRHSDEYRDCIQHVVVGKGFQNMDEIKARDQCAKLYYNLDARELRDLMLYCDIAITAAGQTVHELMVTKLPFVCIKVIDNQENNIRGLLKHGVITEYFDSENKSNTQIRNELRRIPEMIKQALSMKNNILISKGAKNIIQELIR